MPRFVIDRVPGQREEALPAGATLVRDMPAMRVVDIEAAAPLGAAPQATWRPIAVSTTATHPTPPPATAPPAPANPPGLSSATTPSPTAPPPAPPTQAPPTGPAREGRYHVLWSLPVMRQDTDWLRSLGLRVLRVEGLRCLVRGAPVIDRMRRDPRVVDVVIAPPRDLLPEDWSYKPSEHWLKQVLTLRFDLPEDATAAAPLVRRMGMRVLARRRRLLVVDAGRPLDPGLRADVLGLPGLATTEPRRLPHLNMDAAVHAVGADLFLNQGPWDGTGEVVAVTDGGLDADHTRLAGAQPDVQDLGMPAWLTPYATLRGATNPEDTSTGHGTHVAGLITARAITSGGAHGVAPGARLVFQAGELSRAEIRLTDAGVEQFGEDEVPPGALLGIPLYAGTLVRDAMKRGARIHNHSWGAAVSGEYTLESESMDAACWRHPEMLCVVAAGNRGEGGLDAPGTAKNVLTVGATARSGDDFDQVWHRSSRGPCKTGRHKPDLVAPGVALRSLWSAELGGSAGIGEGTAGEELLQMSGTSMATPIVSGIAAVLRQWLRAHETTPTAALLKALLLHATRPIDGAGRDVAGFGRVHLGEVVNHLGTDWRWFDVDDDRSPHMGLWIGEAWQVEVRAAGPLRVTLVWPDSEGEVLGSTLWLSATDAGGTTLSVDPSSPDNVQRLELSAGRWIVRVSAPSVDDTQGPQPFAVVVSGEGLQAEEPAWTLLPDRPAPDPGRTYGKGLSDDEPDPPDPGSIPGASGTAADPDPPGPKAPSRKTHTPGAKDA